jgi:serine/threonine protein kinase
VTEESEDMCLQKGSVLKGIYKIKETLSKGELSTTYIGEILNEKRKYIIKEYFPKKLVLRDIDNKTVLCRMPSLKEKYYSLREVFFNEAVILKKFDHKNIVKYTDHFIENNSGYIVTEYCEGKTLDKYIKENKTISITDFSKKIVIPLINTLEWIHKKDIIHRDIKPSNIIINSKGEPIIIDFGSAINHKECDKKKIFVTPGFSPLEFYSEISKQDKYSDIYSLSAMLYYCLCGKPPMEVSERIIEDNIINIKNYNKEISILFSSIIMKNLSVDYKKRFSSLKLFKTFVYFEYFLLRIKNLLCFDITFN